MTAHSDYPHTGEGAARDAARDAARPKLVYESRGEVSVR